MVSAADAILPDRETARTMGWAYQVQWVDDGKVCFARYRHGGRADKAADDLRRAGKRPMVYDLRDLLQLH